MLNFHEFINENLDRLKKYVYDAGINFLSSGDIEELLNDYPNDKKILLYRGMFFNEKEDVINFIEKIKKNKIDLKRYSSWTRSRSTAVQFALTKPTNNIMFLGREFFKAEDDRKRSKDYTQGYGIVIKTYINPGEGIDVSKSGVAQEDEIILPSGKYTLKIETIFNPYKEEVTEISDINDWIQNQRGMSSKKEGIRVDFSMMEYILQNFESDINDKSKKHLFNLFSRGNLSGEWQIEEEKYPRYITKPGKSNLSWDLRINGGDEDPDNFPEGKLQKEFSIYLKEFNQNLIYYFYLFTEDDQERIKKLCLSLVKDLEKKITSIRRKNSGLTLFFKYHPFFEKILDKRDTKNLHQLINSDIGAIYRSMNSTGVKDINNIKDPQKKRQAIQDMAETLKNLLQKI